MSTSWIPSDTTRHQDHVIAHVVGTVVLGYFVFDEAVYLLLDIGFLWTIFLNCEMALLPHPVAIAELEVPDQVSAEIKIDIEILLGANRSQQLLRMKHLPLHTLGEDFTITEVNLFEREDCRRLLLGGDAATLAIETSLTTAGIKIYEFNQ